MSWTLFVFKFLRAEFSVLVLIKRQVRSVRNKSAVLMDYLCDCKADLYAITETWLTEDDAAVRAELNMDGYIFLDHPQGFYLGYLRGRSYPLSPAKMPSFPPKNIVIITVHK